MKYLNIGCGNYYSTESIWTNLDFASGNKYVIAHNLLKGIPFNDNSFDFIYHSHVLEHFSKRDGEGLLRECYRVLNSNGIIRIVIPDLEMIVRNYIHLLEKGMKNPNDEIARSNYDWILLEMYDQTVRNYSGGEMGRYLVQPDLLNEKFIFERIGLEGKNFRDNALSTSDQNENHNYFLNRIKLVLREVKNFKLFKGSNSTYNEIGRFRLGGEVHQWMYDRYSLSQLL